MSSKEPRQVKKDIKVCNAPDLDGKSIEEIIVELQAIENEYATSEFFNLRYYKDWRFSYYADSEYDVILGDRLETDKEYNQRIARKKKRKESEAKRKATVLENKKKELSKLKEQVAKLEQQIGE